MPRVLNYHDIKPAPIPDGAEYIGREARQHGLPQSKWHNPYLLRRNATPEERTEVIRKFELYLYASGLIAHVYELRGKDLVCWCAPEPCHGDVLLRLANPVEH